MDSVPQTQSLGHYKNGVCKMVVEQKRHVDHLSWAMGVDK